MLNKIFLFKELNADDIEEIISKYSTIQTFKPKDIIYSDIKFPHAIGIVIKGKCYALTNNSGNVYMNNFETGDCFGVAAIFGNKEKYVSTIISKTKTEILFINEKNLKQIFLMHPQVSLNYIEFLSNKIRFLNTKLKVLSNSATEDTVLNYLTTVTNGGGFAEIPVNMTMLAKMLGIGRASLYRSIDSLESKGIIIRENNKIKVIKNEKIS